MTHVHDSLNLRTLIFESQVISLCSRRRGAQVRLKSHVAKQPRTQRACTCVHVMVPFFQRARSVRRLDRRAKEKGDQNMGAVTVSTWFPENLPDSMLTLPIMVLESSKLLQNDRFSHSSLAPQEPLWKHFVSEVIPEKLIFTPFGRR